MKTMKKGMKLLSMSMALMMVLSLVLSTVVFAASPYKKEYATTDTNMYSFVPITDVYRTNSNYNYYFVGNGTVVSYFTVFADGGLWMQLPFSDAGIPAVAEVTSATLTMPIRISNSTNETKMKGNNSTRLLVHNVTESEYNAVQDAMENGADGTFYGESDVYSYTPQSIKNYIAAGSSAPANNANYQDGGYQSFSLNTDNGTKRDEDLAYDYELDITDLIKDGSLTEDRYLVLQKGLNYNSGSSKYYSHYAYYVPVLTMPPTLTVHYNLPDKAETLTSSHSLLDSSTAIVEMETGYGYQINFDGELSPDTVTAENVLLTDSDGGTDATIGYTVEVSDDNKSIIVKFPYDDGTKDYDSDGNGSIDAYYKWLTAGETYHITLTNGLKNAWDEVLYENGHTIQVTMSDAIEHGVRLNQIRWAENGTTGSVPSTNVLDEEITVGAHGTVKGEMLWGYGQYYNFTAHGTPILGMIVVYDEDKNMKQATAYSINADRNMRSGYLTPRLTLNESLVAGDTIKFFVWNGYDPLRTDGSYATGMKTISVVE